MTVPPSDEEPLRKILVIDDDAISRELLTTILDIHGFVVESAEDGAEALALLANGTGPGLILMDTQMPGLSGVKLVESLRSASTARIVAISGSEVGEQIRRATDGFLLKPIDVEAVATIFDDEEAEATAVQEHFPAGVIDSEALEKLRTMMPEKAVLEIFTAVADDLEKRLGTLQAAMQDDNGDEVHRIAHAIKGGCAMAGLKSAAEVASRLEIGTDHRTWPEELSQLHSAHRGLQGILEDGLP